MASVADTLLPINATLQERSLEAATARVSAVDVPVRDIWNPDTCPAPLLPWLAWAFRVNSWLPDMAEQQQRDAIKASVYVHRHKGTAGAVRAALGALGIGCQMIEWWQDLPAADPFTFRIALDADQTPITLDTLHQLLASVERTKNARSHLSSITPGATSRAEVFSVAVAAVGSEISLCGFAGTLLLDGTWALDASQIIDGFKRTDTHTLDGTWSLNGATTLNGIQA